MTRSCPARALLRVGGRVTKAGSSLTRSRTGRDSRSEDEVAALEAAHWYRPASDLEAE